MMIIGRGMRAVCRRGRRGPAWPALLALLLVVGCAGRLVPPGEPVAPVTVYLLDHGRHASLVLPREDGRLARYSYGDWHWYVEGRRGPLSGLAALLWPTPGALGRSLGEGGGDPRALAPEGVERVHALRVERRRVQALRRRLDARFAAADAAPVHSADFGLAFVPHPRSYWFAHQSNLVVAGWLRELGVEVGGSPWLSDWRLVPGSAAP